MSLRRFFYHDRKDEGAQIMLSNTEQVELFVLCATLLVLREKY